MILESGDYAAMRLAEMNKSINNVELPHGLLRSLLGPDCHRFSFTRCRMIWSISVEQGLSEQWGRCMEGPKTQTRITNKEKREKEEGMEKKKAEREKKKVT